MTKTDENERIQQWKSALEALEKLLDESGQRLQLYIDQMKNATGYDSDVILTSKIDPHYSEAIDKLENFVRNRDIDESGEWFDSLNYVCQRFGKARDDFSTWLEAFQDFESNLEERQELGKMLGNA